MDPTAKFLTDKNWHVHSKVITEKPFKTSVSKCTLNIHFETEKKSFIDNTIIIIRWCAIYGKVIIIKFSPLQKRSRLISRYLQEEQKAG